MREFLFDLAQEGIDFFAHAARNAIDKENAIDMVVFMHSYSGIIPLELFDEGFAVDILGLHPDAIGTLYL
jgi:hypothetical protein